MKQFVVLLVFALAATTMAKPEVNKDQVAHSAQKVKQAHEKCQADPATAVDESALKNLHKGGEAPANIAAYTLCISKNLGWQHEDGSINKDYIQSRAEAIFGASPKLQQIVDECAAGQATPEATAQHLFKCYRKYSPRPQGQRAA
uniref:Odorant binding protein 13 n=1 Tax=Anthonomus eugenii TaxID=122869 RepID=A0AA96C8A3_9CUCU|nr:odorant binding protein 13 [Anthonomus eugenii]